MSEAVNVIHALRPNRCDVQSERCLTVRFEGDSALLTIRKRYADEFHLRVSRPHPHERNPENECYVEQDALLTAFRSGDRCTVCGIVIYVTDELALRVAQFARDTLSVGRTGFTIKQYTSPGLKF